jgi:catechol 2,3-dioxygenase-like lactoylglutathione lyase family enzyme
VKYLITMLLIVVSATVISAQSADDRPFLVAAQVSNLDQSIAWYTDFLEFKLTDKKSYAEYGMKIAMLQRDGFQLELVENVRTKPKEEALKKLEADEITGFAKIAFRSADIRSLYKRLQDKKAEFRVVLRDSNLNDKEHFFIMADPDGNWIQFVGSK